MKNYKGKAIYNPSGKAGEYSYWACNFYVGCSNGCSYCYLKKGRGKAILGGDRPVLKKCFKDEGDALKVFEKEVLANLDELLEHGLFFTFTSDPLLPETYVLTRNAIWICLNNNVPVKVLSKNADIANPESGIYSYFNNMLINFQGWQRKIAFGFTLTGFDDMEPNASTNMQRIEAMNKLHKAGFKTWASIEPVISISESLAMINMSQQFCDLYKIGLESGRRYPKQDLQIFVEMVCAMFPDSRFYFKDTLLKQAGIERSKLPANFVDRDYNIFIK